MNLLSMNILERYIGKTIIMMMFAVLLMSGGLIFIIKLVEEFKNVGEGNYDALTATYYALLMLPSDIKEFVPVVLLIGGLLGLGNLASHSELVIMQSTGFSRFRIGLAVMKTAIPIIILTMSASEWIIPKVEQFARNMRSVAQSGGSMLSTNGGFWAKDGNNFLYIRHIENEHQLNNISIYHFENKVLTSVSQADSALFNGKDWTLQNLQTATITDHGIQTTHQASQNWQTTITPSKLGIVSLKPESLSIAGLADYVNFLTETGQDSKRFQIAFWRKVYQPISMAVMMLLAISFIFGPLRSSAMGTKLFIGIIAGFIFYVSNIVFGNMTLVFSWLPIAIGALIPSLICLAIVWWLLTKKRD
ncbi:LPS export ABC transporter permease LptG [[Haemophilus] ducreyi]|uniref:LPS export ABC transporter permease LptG n=1 Tax=Haemophilus ducreyi TaxID=730 RepID=UPI000655A33B|nr:LPS export ABC transporter permease LptG [[Haemophilus] ducreyi]AKO45054.1 lipopolysaccharide ABC transporter permease [[Haemophilus] ducreyi]AKO46456.1 lipopolysaccharide ABC transporter permease [[Haemophilus] ducreyi]AKO47798.1 lipopolysaccharide ABC transporter permease [[Haemophilus] ducreyi]AKO49185.1 lipopolysaccharide ABC transporter permease [[Haemophilus] ducreyi]ANF62234.1 lipopolysaccharide ABC transporter permease LptG [[Haemophilus] ducreyi]